MFPSILQQPPLWAFSFSCRFFWHFCSLRSSILHWARHLPHKLQRCRLKMGIIWQTPWHSRRQKALRLAVLKLLLRGWTSRVYKFQWYVTGLLHCMRPLTVFVIRLLIPLWVLTQEWCPLNIPYQLRLHQRWCLGHPLSRSWISVVLNLLILHRSFASVHWCTE